MKALEDAGHVLSLVQGSIDDSARPVAETQGDRPGSEPLRVAELYSRHFPFVWRVLRSLGVNEAVLDDAAQDVFLAAHRRFGDYEGRSSPRTWLFSIAYRVALNYRRTQRRKGGTSPLDASSASSAPGPLDEAQRSQAGAFVQRFLEGLDEGKRAVFVLCVLEEATAPEAANALGVPEGTVYSRLHKTRRLFREALLATYGDPSHERHR